MRSIKEREEGFQYWIFSISDDLEDLVEELKEKGVSLDFSRDSLDTLEKWVLTNFESKEELMKEENKFLLDKISKYIGEVFRAQLDGKWNIELKNEKDVYYNLPIITGDNIFHPVAPLTLVTACIRRNKGNYISNVLQSYLDDLSK